MRQCCCKVFGNPDSACTAIHSEFTKWVDIQCTKRWNELFEAEAWAERFKKIYSSDEELKSILTLKRTDGFSLMKGQLIEQVGHGGIGLVAHEIFTKLEELFPKGLCQFSQVQFSHVFFPSFFFPT